MGSAVRTDATVDTASAAPIALNPDESKIEEILRLVIANGGITASVEGFVRLSQPAAVGAGKTEMPTPQPAVEVQEECVEGPVAGSLS